MNGPDTQTLRLRRALAGWRAAGHTPTPPETIDLAPKSTHEAITRQMVEDLTRDLAEVKTRVNALLWLVAGSILVSAALRLAGLE
jgi:hypothetical protein